MTQSRPLCATYRLQLNRGQTFRDALNLVPYLHALGVSHLYSSPCLKTRKGSMHGYDIIDHSRLNPELGGESEFKALVKALHERGMGLIMDIVPNHMGVGSDNGWWMDVLEHGEASLYAGYFDIDWLPNNRVLQNKLLLPFLGDHYGEVLERGELRLVLNTEEGSFHVRYFEHRFPIDPRTWNQILGHLVSEFMNAKRGQARKALPELQSLLRELQALPRRSTRSKARKRLRREKTGELKARFARLLQGSPALREDVERMVESFNGQPGQGASFDRLHRLLESQAYRLSFWKVAADEINYRRFFDVNDLAGLRMEDDEVFQITHKLIGNLARKGLIDGVRVDHVDGLSDPSAYCIRLRDLLNADGDRRHIYLEKILARRETLHPAWPVDGTTGYEFGAAVNGLFIHPGSQGLLSRLYNRFAIPTRHKTGMVGRNFAGIAVDFAELVYTSKKLIIQNALSGELTVLVNLLSRLAQTDRATRDFTFNSLRTSLIEVVACFPVYRTYITWYRFSESDRQYVHEAVTEAIRRNPGFEMQLNFIHGILVATPFARHEVPRTPEMGRLINAFCLRFQQYTSMVEAKGLEDTACYRFNRLVPLNEVGFDPCAFGHMPGEFHAENRRRLESRPTAMLSTSTHDSKRGEDVRTRIDVITEVADEWKLHVLFWKRLNQRLKARQRGGKAVPSDNDEYLLYQTLLGAWPMEELSEKTREAFAQRIEAYMIKAVREAKVHTSWANPSPIYEQGLLEFIRALLDPQDNPFLADFLPFQARMARYGLLNSLSQTLLKLCAPGVPDIYQGNELFLFNLVDPDNRRQVDFDVRRRLLEDIQSDFALSTDKPALLWSWIDTLEDGRAKLFIHWRALQFRREHPQLFLQGDYLPLRVDGSRAEHVVAFARRHEGRTFIVVAARWFARLHEHGYPAPNASAWGNTLLEAPEGQEGERFRNWLTDEEIEVMERENKKGFKIQDLLSHFPVAVLTAG